ncbi:MAG: serine hydrolase [Enhydrobacter sp.]|nr:serine hydrolase [Enhydrobacter sp.]
MTIGPGQAPQEVLKDIQSYLGNLDKYFTQNDITYTAAYDLVAGTSINDEVWSTDVKADKRMFVGSAVKSFILAEFLRQNLSQDELARIDESVRSISSPVFGDEILGGKRDPEVKLEGLTPFRTVLEAMISHSDNTATDAALAAVGADKVRELIADLGLSSVKIAESTRRLFTFLASGRDRDVDWETLQSYALDPPHAKGPINGKESMLASASDMVRWYQTALLDPAFFDATQLAEFKRISGMADALFRVVPSNIAAYGKGGSITWNGFSCINVSGQMVVPTSDPEQPWMPVTFSFTVNWDRDDRETFNDVGAILVRGMKNILQASLDSFYFVVTDFSLTLGADNLTGTAGRDDFAGPGGGMDSIFGLAGDDAFHIRANQIGSIDGGSGRDTIFAIDDQLNAGLTLTAVEELNAALPSIRASVAQIAAFDTIVPSAGGPDFSVLLQSEGGRLDFSSRWVSPVLLNVDATQATSRVVLTGSARDDSLLGSLFNDVLAGGVGDDHVSGGAGDDRISGGAGLDALDGGLGFNTVTYAEATRSIQVDLAKGTGKGEGKDTLANFQRVIGSAQADALLGDADANVLHGMDDDDTLKGRAGNDRLIGGNGADMLAGGLGADTLTGGAGPDLFQFYSVAESTVAGAGWDRIRDFNAAEGDQIDLRTADARLVASGKAAFTFIGNNPFSHTAGELNYLVSGAATFLNGDVNGDGVADFSVRLDNVPTLTGANILL